VGLHGRLPPLTATAAAWSARADGNAWQPWTIGERTGSFKVKPGLVLKINVLYSLHFTATPDAYLTLRYAPMTRVA
jgi:hypothetical protein